MRAYTCAHVDRLDRNDSNQVVLGDKPSCIPCHIAQLIIRNQIVQFDTTRYARFGVVLGCVASPYILFLPTPTCTSTS